MEDEKPLISIGVPTYNRLKTLKEVMRCLLGQTYSNLEIIVSDNHSDDGTELFLRNITQDNNRVKYIRHSYNRGAYLNFKSALDSASSDIFMWFADDDICDSEYVEEIWKCYSSTTNTAIAFCGFDWLREDFSLISDYPKVFKLVNDDLFSSLYCYIQQGEEFGKANPIYGMMNKNTLLDALSRIGNDIHVMGCDMLLVFEVLTKGKLAMCPKVLFHKFGSYSCAEARVTPSKLQMYKTFRKNWNDWNAYLSGYIHSINRTSLNSEEKIKLQFLVESRWKNKMAELYQSEGGRILPSIITRLVHRQNLK